MTSNRVWRTYGVIVGAALFMCVTAGCGGGGSLPDTVTVELPDGTSAVVSLGAGVPSLADSTWQFYQSFGSGQSLPFMLITFGPQGDLASFENNSIAPEIFGDTILFDGERHATAQAGLSYVAATYGAETSDATGFAFQGLLTAYAAGFKAAEATTIASGTFAPDDPDTMTGEFSIVSEVTIMEMPEANIDESFAFIAHRVVE